MPMKSHSDFEVKTRWFRIGLALCQFCESIWPAAYSGPTSIDLFVPLPDHRTLWIAGSSPVLNRIKHNSIESRQSEDHSDISQE